MKSAVPDRATLAGLLPGEICTLADPTHTGGTMNGRIIAEGAMVRVAFHGVTGGAYAGRSFVEEIVDGRYGSPSPVWSTAKVGKVLVSRKPGDSPGNDGDAIDPVARGSLKAVDSPLFAPEKP